MIDTMKLHLGTILSDLCLQSEFKHTVDVFIVHDSFGQEIKKNT